MDIIFIPPLYGLLTFSWDFPFYIIVLWVMALLFSWLSPSSFSQSRPTAFGNNVKYFQRKFLQNPVESATIILRLLRNFIKSTDYLLFLFPMISLVPNSMVNLTWYWLNQWTNKRVCFFILLSLSKVASTQPSFQKQQKSNFLQ